MPILLFARSPCSITGDSFEQVSGRGLLIETNPSGVTVFVDGRERGTTPITITNMAQGDYLIRLEKDGYETRTFNVTVFDTSRLNVSIKMKELQGFVNITVRRDPNSPQALPFEPHITASSQDFLETWNEFSSDNNILLTLPARVNAINIRAFGWESVMMPVLIEENVTTALNIVMQPAQMKIERITQLRARFNPLRSTSYSINIIRFQVTTYGSGTMTVFDSDNLAIYTEELQQFDNPFRSIVWNGKDSDGNIVPQGIYTITIEAKALSEYSHGEPQSVSASIQTEVNYSLNVLPLSIESGSAGLSFSPLPSVFKFINNYQINAGLSFDTDGFPFKIGLRVLPFNRFELAAAFGVNPQLNGENAIWSITGSAKYNILNGTGSVPIAFSLGASYEWATGTHENNFSAGRGIGFFAPLSLELANFSIVLSPGAFWRGPEGAVPDFQLSAGVLYRAFLFNAGISARYEFDFNVINNSRLLASAEARFFPEPSFVFYTLQGGIIMRGEKINGYGGIGVGLIVN